MCSQIGPQRMKAILLLVVLFAALALADVKATPYLMVHKEASEGSVIVGTDVKFTVTVTNHGDGPAFDVQLVDQSPNGNDETKAVEKLDAGESFTIDYTFKPTELGELLVGAAKASYLEEQGASTRHTSSSNLVNEADRKSYEEPSRGELNVVTATQYERLHTRYIKEIIGYVFAAAVPVLFPFYMYRSKQSQVDHLLREAKRTK